MYNFRIIKSPKVEDFNVLFVTPTSIYFNWSLPSSLNFGQSNGDDSLPSLLYQLKVTRLDQYSTDDDEYIEKGKTDQTYASFSLLSSHPRSLINSSYHGQTSIFHTNVTYFNVTGLNPFQYYRISIR